MENNFKRFLSLLLAFVMVLGMFPVGRARAAESNLEIGEPITGTMVEGMYAIRTSGVGYGDSTVEKAYLTGKASGDKLALTLEDTPVWTVTAANAGDNTYYVTDPDGNYLVVVGSGSNVTSEPTVLKLYYGQGQNDVGAWGFYIENAAGDQRLNFQGGTTEAQGKGGTGSWAIWEFVEVHNWGSGSQTTAPGCESAGEVTYTCTFEGCDKTKTGEIAALGHEFQREGGESIATCSCGVSNPGIIDTAEELQAALNEGGEVVLGGNISTLSNLTVPEDVEVVLNLNGFDVIREGDTQWNHCAIENNGTLTIMGEGEVAAARSGSAVITRNKLVVNGGTYKSYQDNVYVASGIATVNGGTFHGVFNGNYQNVAVTGGTFLREDGFKNMENATITGGTYAWVLTNTLPEGYLLVYRDSSNTWAVVNETEAVARIGSTGYMTLQDAIGDVDPDNDEYTVIEMLNSYGVTDTVVIDQGKKVELVSTWGGSYLWIGVDGAAEESMDGKPVFEIRDDSALKISGTNRFEFDVAEHDLFAVNGGELYLHNTGGNICYYSDKNVISINGGYADIKSGRFDADGSLVFATGGDVTVDTEGKYGMHITSDGTTFDWQSTGTLSIKNAEVIWSDTNILHAKTGTVNISGGWLKAGYTETGFAVMADAGAQLNITGGKFSTENPDATTIQVAGQAGFISGGSFDMAVPEEMLTDDVVCFEQMVDGVKWYLVQDAVKVHFCYASALDVTVRVPHNSVIPAEKIPAAPEQEHYNFIGWYAGDTEVDLTAPVTQNLELEAKYERITYTVTVNPNNGSEAYDVTVNSGDRMGAPEVEYADHRLEGWYTDANFTIPYNFETAVTGGMELYAKWTEIVYAAKIGEQKYETFEAALAASSEGDEIVLLIPVVVSEDTTLNLYGRILNGNGVYPAFRVVNNAALTIEGGEFFNETDYLFVLGSSDQTEAGKLVINDGSFKAMTSVVSVTKGSLVVNGGTFKCFNNSTYLLNCIDANYQNGTAAIEVFGGSFEGFNPMRNTAEGANTCFTANGYCSVNVDGSYVVAKHEYDSVVTAPTCEGKGYTTHTCARCSDSYADTYVDAKGHTEVKDAAKAPTCTETGLTEGKHCSVCETVLVAQTVVDALNHKWVVSGYTDNGENHTVNYICENDATHTDSKTEGHTFAEGKCDYCGAEEVTNYVAMIGTKGYASLQAAIGAVENGQTIRLLADITEDVTIKQEKNVAFTIDGLKETATASEDGEGIVNDEWYTCYATITVNGTKSAYDNNQGLTIQNVNFVLQKRAQVGIATAKSSFVRGLTVRNCTFTGSGAGEDAVYGINLRHVYDITVEDCTATDVYDLVYAQNSVDGLTVEDVTVTDSVQAFFLAYGTNLKFTRVNTDNVSVAIGVKNQTNNGTMTITDCNLSAETPVSLIQASATNKFTVTFEGNTIVNTPEWLVVTDNDGNEITDSNFAVVLNGDDDAEDDVTAPAAYVAMIGTKGYATLAAAIANATAGDTITLLADISENVTLDKSLTIDGGNFKYTGKMDIWADAEYVTVQNVNFVKGYINKDDDPSKRGYLTVKGCTFDGVDKSIGYAITYRMCNGIVIEDCTAKNYSTGMLYLPSETHIINVKDVEVSDCAAAFNIVYANQGTFENVKVSNATYGIHSPNHGDRTFTLTNCVFDCANPAYVPKQGTATVTFVFEGTANVFTNAASYSSSYTKFVLHQDSVLTAPQVFSNEITTDAEGCEVVYENGAYRVVEKKSYVAQIGEQGYETLAAAITAASAGDTITFLADITEDVTVNKSVTIDGAGKTYTGMMKLTNKADITIKNVNFDGKGEGTYAVEARGANYVTIEDCTAQNYGYGFLQNASGTVLTTVKNVTVSNCNYGVKIDYATAVVLENVKLDCAVAGVLNSNYGEKTVTIKNSDISILGTWTRNDTIKSTIVFEGANTVGEFVIDADIDIFKLADVNSTLTAPQDIEVIADFEGYKVVYENGAYKAVEANYVAEVNGVKYETLAAAITAASAGDTITLLADIEENVTVSKSVTIDGAEKNYTGTMTGNAGLSITVKNVNFVNGGFAKTTKSSSGTYTFDNCTFNGAGQYAYAFYFKGAYTVKIENCSVKNYLYSFLYVSTSAVNVTVKDVTVEDCASYAVYFGSGVSSATFEELTVKNSARGFLINNTANRSFTIKNCKMENVDTAVDHANGTKTITCKVAGENNFGTAVGSEYAKYVLTEVNSTLTAVENLTVTTDVADHKVIYEEGTHKVVQKVYVAQIGETKYETLTEAVANAVAGDTIVLLSENAESVSLGVSITLDVASFAYTGTVTLTDKAAELTAPEGLSVTTDVADCKVVYADGAYKVVEKVYVAEVMGGAKYESLAAAIAAASSGSTVKLLADIAENVSFAGKTLTLDGDNHTLNGSITKTGKGSITIRNFHFDGTGYGDYALRLTAQNGKIFLEDCTVKNYTTYGFLTIPNSTNSLTVKNVTVDNVFYGLKLDRCNTVALENVTMTNVGRYGIYDSNYATKNYTIKNCTIDAKIAPICIWDRNTGKTETFVFEGTNDFGSTAVELAGLGNMKLLDVNTTVAGIEGMTFTTDVAEHKVAYEDGIYKVVPLHYVAQVGEAKFETLTEAIAAAVAGDTIVLLDTVEENVTLDKNLTIDGADQTYTGTMTVKEDLHITVENLDFVKGSITKVKSEHGSLTVKDCNFDGQKAIGYAIDYNGDYVTIEDCTAKDYTVGMLYVKAETNNVFVKNVEVTDCAVAFNISRSNDGSFENVTLNNVTYGLHVQNYSSRTYTLSGWNAVNSDHPVYIQNKGTATVTFVFDGGNDFGTKAAHLFGYGALKLADADSYLTAQAGMTVTTDVADHKVVYENETTYRVVPMVYVAEVNGVKYESIQEAVNAANDADTVTVIKDHELTWDGETKIDGSMASMVVVAGKAVIIDLNGKNVTVDGAQMNGTDLYAVFAADEGGSLTLKDSIGTGSVEAKGNAFAASGTTAYCMMMAYEPGTKLTVERGTYTMETAHDCLIYSGDNECVVINGGTFTLGNVGTGENGKPWIFNAYGQNVNTIIVNGGTFNADVNHQAWSNEVFVPKTLALEAKDDGTWTVVNAVAYTVERGSLNNAKDREVGHATLAEAVAHTAAGQTVTLLANNAEAIELDRHITMDVNGFTFSGKYTLTAEDAALTAPDGLTVDTTVENAMVKYDGNTYKLEKAVAKNEQTGKLYDDLSDGLDEAVSGQTVTLLVDTEEALVLVPAGVTFDLNGCVVEAKNALSFGVVKDSATKVGGIKISNDTTQAFVKLQPDNDGYLPIYDSTNKMYKFFKFELVNGGCKQVNENKVRFGVKILFENSEAYTLLADEENNSCISLYLRITWDGLKGQYINYKFTASGIAKYATSVLNAAPGKSPALTLDITGISGLEAGESLSAAPWLETLTEVAADTEYVTYTKQ